MMVAPDLNCHEVISDLCWFHACDYGCSYVMLHGLQGASLDSSEKTAWLPIPSFLVSKPVFNFKTDFALRFWIKGVDPIVLWWESKACTYRDVGEEDAEVSGGRATEKHGVWTWSVRMWGATEGFWAGMSAWKQLEQIRTRTEPVICRQWLL